MPGWLSWLSVQLLILASVMISWFVGSSPTSISVLTVWSLSDSLSPSLWVASIQTFARILHLHRFVWNAHVMLRGGFSILEPQGQSYMLSRVEQEEGRGLYPQWCPWVPVPVPGGILPESLVGEKSQCLLGSVTVTGFLLQVAKS